MKEKGAYKRNMALRNSFAAVQQSRNSINLDSIGQKDPLSSVLNSFDFNGPTYTISEHVL
jgi:hypothetical protein